MLFVKQVCKEKVKNYIGEIISTYKQGKKKNCKVWTFNKRFVVSKKKKENEDYDI